MPYVEHLAEVVVAGKESDDAVGDHLAECCYCSAEVGDLVNSWLAYEGGSLQSRVVIYHFLGVAGLVREIKVRAHQSLCQRLCHKVGVRNDVAVAECTKSL